MIRGEEKQCAAFVIIKLFINLIFFLWKAKRVNKLRTTMYKIEFKENSQNLLIQNICLDIFKIKKKSSGFVYFIQRRVSHRFTDDKL